MFRRLAVVFAVLVLGAVGMIVVIDARQETRLDTSSDAALKASLDRMLEGMPPAEQKQFLSMLVIRTIPESARVGFESAVQGRPRAPTPSEALQPYHGKTLRQLRELVTPREPKSD